MAQHASLLIIEDELGPAESLRMIFKSTCEVVIVRDLPSALDVMRSRRIDVITLDLQLGSRLGGPTIRDLRCADSEVEILAITGLPPSAPTAREVRALGAHYIAKPFEVEQVRNIVLEALARRTRQSLPGMAQDWGNSWISQLRAPVSAIIDCLDSLHDQSAFTELPQGELLASIRANAQALHCLLGDNSAVPAVPPTRQLPSEARASRPS